MNTLLLRANSRLNSSRVLKWTFSPHSPLSAHVCTTRGASSALGPRIKNSPVLHLSAPRHTTTTARSVPIFRPFRAVHNANGGNGKNGKGNPNQRGLDSTVPDEKKKFLHQETDTATMLKGLSVMPTPRTVHVLPLNFNPVFGGTSYYSLVDRKTLNAMHELQAKGEIFLGLFLSKDPSNKAQDISKLHQVGQLGCAIGSVQYTSNPDVHLLQVTPLSRRIRIKAPVAVNETVPDALIAVEIEELIEEEYDPNDSVIRANHNAIVSAIKQLHEFDPSSHYQKLLDEMDPDNAAEFADLAASVISSEPLLQQAVLEAVGVKERQIKTLELLNKKLEIFKRQKEIREEKGAEAEEKKELEEQRKYFLEKKKRAIEKELGTDIEESDKLIEEYNNRIKERHIPEDVMGVIKEEMNKLTAVEKSSSEYNITRSYLNWLTQLPWGLYTDENLNVSRSRTVLDKDHFGLKDIKERILEFVAVGNLRGSVQGKILCFAGPPGVGKTSIGQSIAKALDREFFRFSVGGMSDVSEIKGHRRTYVGAMPGKLVQSLKNLKSANPVILIDEIDKMGSSRQGDPASALLEVLDPEQNKAFLDHYLDVPFDLSKVLFVCTANVTDTIPGPLLDRMEVIQLSGYILEEKMNIAKRHLIPQIRKESGLSPKHAEITNSALHHLIQSYAREAGVRELYKHLEKIFRKVAFKVAKAKAMATKTVNAESPATNNEESNQDSEQKEKKQSKKKNKNKAETIDIEPHVITESNLHEYVGQPKFTSDRFYETTVPGVVMGLAWTAMGGATLYIETVNDRPFPNQLTKTTELTDEPKEGSDKDDEEKEVGGGRSSGMRLLTTGQMGSVMQESTSIAYTFAKNFLEDISPMNPFFDKASLHMHIPEGATPKDGPSAGCTMVTSLLSLSLGRSVPPDIAMTGEITLTGKILTIGGVKEKTIAARRSGVKRLIFPEGNRKDWEELPDHIKRGLQPHFVAHYKQIFDIVFDGNKNKTKKSSASQNAYAQESATLLSPQRKPAAATRRKKDKVKEETKEVPALG